MNYAITSKFNDIFLCEFQYMINKIENDYKISLYFSCDCPENGCIDEDPLFCKVRSWEVDSLHTTTDFANSTEQSTQVQGVEGTMIWTLFVLLVVVIAAVVIAVWYKTRKSGQQESWLL